MPFHLVPMHKQEVFVVWFKSPQISMMPSLDPFASLALLLQRGTRYGETLKSVAYSKLITPFRFNFLAIADLLHNTT